MKDFLTYLTKTLREVHGESYYSINPANPVIYPYLTFDFNSEALERNKDGFSIELDIFDYSSSYQEVAELESKLKDSLSWRRDLTDEILAVWSFEDSNAIPTGDEELKRRNIRFYVKVDWRQKRYGTT